MRVGTKWAKGNVDLYTAQPRDIAFSSPDYHNLMIYAKGVAATTADVIAHGLGYIPGYTGYIKDLSGKYFLNYSASAGATSGFENSLYGDISTDATNLYLTCATAGRLCYLLYANPVIPSLGAALGGAARVGAQFAEDLFTLLSGVGRKTFNTDYQMPLVIDSGTATITTTYMTPTTGVADDTTYVDVAHNQPQANHILCPDYFGSALLPFIPNAVGAGPAFQFKDYELYVDATKIRFRVSRHIDGSGLVSVDYPAETITFKWFLTNVKLP